MPKTKLQELIFTLMMVPVMVTWMVLYNLWLSPQGLTGVSARTGAAVLELCALALAVEFRFSDCAADKLLSDTASGRRGAVHGQSDVPLHELYGHALATRTAGRMGVGLGRNAAGQLSHGAGVAASGRRPCRAGDVRFFAEALLARGHSGRIARVSRCRRLYHRTTTAFRKTLAPTPNLC